MNLFTRERLQTGVLFTINQLSQLLRNMLQLQTLRLNIFVLYSIKYNSKRISKCFYLHNFFGNLVPLKPLSSSTKCTFDNFSYFTDSGNAAQCQHVQKKLRWVVESNPDWAPSAHPHWHHVVFVKQLIVFLLQFLLEFVTVSPSLLPFMFSHPWPSHSRWQSYSKIRSMSHTAAGNSHQKDTWK